MHFQWYERDRISSFYAYANMSFIQHIEYKQQNMDTFQSFS